MIEEQARVLAVQADTATVAVERRSACGNCSASGGCGTAVLATWLPNRRLIVRVADAIGVTPGDLVVIGLDEQQFQRIALRLYATPLLGLMIGALLGQTVGPFLGLSPELGSILLGLSGMLAALHWVRRRNSDTGAREGGGVQLLRVVTHAPFERHSLTVAAPAPLQRDTR